MIADTWERQRDAVRDLIQTGQDTDEKMVSWLYRILDTIDSKTAALMRFNAIILAAQAFVIGSIAHEDATGAHALLLLLLLVPLLTAIYSLWVLRVEFPFLWYLGQSGPYTDRLENELTELAKVCVKRRKRNMWVWIGSLGSAATFLFSLGTCIRIIVSASTS